MKEKKIKLNWLNDIMNMYDITNKELSITSGLSNGEISMIRNNQSNPTHDVMLKVCMGLELIIEDQEFLLPNVFEINWRNVNIR
jgi:transcriptional regulator with XRE-family HTH domain